MRRLFSVPLSAGLAVGIKTFMKHHNAPNRIVLKRQGKKDGSGRPLW